MDVARCYRTIFLFHMGQIACRFPLEAPPTSTLACFQALAEIHRKPALLLALVFPAPLSMDDMELWSKFP